MAVGVVADHPEVEPAAGRTLGLGDRRRLGPVEGLRRRPASRVLDVVVGRELRRTRLVDEVPLMLGREEEDLRRGMIPAQRRRLVQVMEGRVGGVIPVGERQVRHAVAAARVDRADEDVPFAVEVDDRRIFDRHEIVRGVRLRREDRAGRGPGEGGRRAAGGRRGPVVVARTSRGDGGGCREDQTTLRRAELSASPPEVGVRVGNGSGNGFSPSATATARQGRRAAWRPATTGTRDETARSCRSPPRAPPRACCCGPRP